MGSILALVLLYSSQYGVDPALAMSVIQVESGFNAQAVGEHGEIGLMQLMPEYFPVSREALFDPRTNIKLGIEHLAEAQKQCKHNQDNSWIVCYNLGVSKGNSIRYPKLFPYYKRVMLQYKRFR